MNKSILDYFKQKEMEKESASSSDTFFYPNHDSDEQSKTNKEIKKEKREMRLAKERLKKRIKENEEILKNVEIINKVVKNEKRKKKIKINSKMLNSFIKIEKKPKKKVLCSLFAQSSKIPLNAEKLKKLEDVFKHPTSYRKKK